MKLPVLHKYAILVSVAISIATSASAAPFKYKKELLAKLVEEVPKLLADQDTSTGQFGKGIWIVQDQHVMYPLAAAWSIRDDDNPYFHDPKLLTAVMNAGDALISAQDKKGMWTFRKKDNSTWGQIFMPWTYSRWIRAYSLVRDGMPAERRVKWDKALLLGFTGIARGELDTYHNIPTHHAMSLYLAGKVFNKPEWSTTAAQYMRNVAKKQELGGYWSENYGPVVGYNFVYVDAIGTYYGMSKDAAVLPCLTKSSEFHANFTYPDGSAVETIDERQVYHGAVSAGGVGFTFSPIGRGYVRRQMELMKKGPGADSIASMLLYGEEGEAAEAPALGNRHYVSPDKLSLVHGENSWCACLSAYSCPVPRSRWIQDRQNLVSIFHPAAGLIVGGGNTKLQPRWSTFSAGDIKLLVHKGEEEPNFLPPPGIRHTPTGARLAAEGVGLELEYDANRTSVRVEMPTSNTARLTYSLDSEPTGTVEAHIPLMPRMLAEWKTGSGKSGKLTTDSVHLSAADAGGWFEHRNWRVSLPEGSSIDWPVLPHNQYRKDGHAEAEEGKIVVTLPFSKAGEHQTVELTVLESKPTVKPSVH